MQQISTVSPLGWKWRFVIKILSTALSLLLGALLIISIGWYNDYQNIPKEHSIGNRASNVKALKEKGFPFSFLVISDTHNSDRAEKLIRAALKGKDASFMIHVGDFVSGPGLWDHRFFCRIWRETSSSLSRSSSPLGIMILITLLRSTIGKQG